MAYINNNNKANKKNSSPIINMANTNAKNMKS